MHASYEFVAAQLSIPPSCNGATQALEQQETNATNALPNGIPTPLCHRPCLGVPLWGHNPGKAAFPQPPESRNTGDKTGQLVRSPIQQLARLQLRPASTHVGPSAAPLQRKRGVLARTTRDKALLTGAGNAATSEKYRPEDTANGS